MDLLTYKANFENHQGQCHLSIEGWERALAVGDEILGRSSLVMLGIAQNLVNGYRVTSQLEKAVKLGMMMLQVSSHFHGRKHHLTIRIKLELACCIYEERDFDEAEKQFLECIEDCQGLDESSKSVGIELECKEGLCCIYTFQERLEDAERIGSELLGANKHRHHLDRLADLRSSNTLALVYLCLGRYKEAEQLLRTSIEAYQKYLGDDHFKTLLAKVMLASVLAKRGKFVEAEELQAAVLEEKHKIIQKGHLTVTHGIWNLVIAYREVQAYGRAVLLLEELLSIYKLWTNDLHADDALKTLLLLGLTYLDMAQYDQAKDLGTQALEQARALLGEVHPMTLNAANALAFICLKQHRWQEAADLNINSLSRKRRVLGTRTRTQF